MTGDEISAPRKVFLKPAVGKTFDENFSWVLVALELSNSRQNKKAVLPQGNRAMLQVFFSVEVRQQHSLQV